MKNGTSIRNTFCSATYSKVTVAANCEISATQLRLSSKNVDYAQRVA